MKHIAFILALLMFPIMAHAQETPKTKTAVFAGGCFWCMESEFQHKKGVIDVVSGYAGAGNAPSYEQVSGGGTGFKESVIVTYDPTITSYNDLLGIFWNNVDPFDGAGQFCDKGDQYKAAIFFDNKGEEKAAHETLTAVEGKYKKHVETQIVPFAKFYAAEEYHQNYYEKNPIRYKFYRTRCGRDARLNELNPDRKASH